MKVLIAGFKPFKKNYKESYKENPSERLVEALKRARIKNVELVPKILPVTFREVEGEVRRMLQTLKPDYLMMFGYYPKATSFEVEKLAKNEVDTSRDGKGARTDNEGVELKGKILEDGPPKYDTTFPILKLSAAFDKYKIPYKESTSPGYFVCNFALYHALDEINHNTSFQTKVAFVHIPSFRKVVSHPNGSKKTISIDNVVNCLKYIFLSLS